MKNKILMFSMVMILSFILTSCIRQGGPIYVDNIEVYADNNFIEGQYVYQTFNGWKTVDEGQKTHEKVYYGVDLNKDSNIEIIMNIYAPNTTLNSLRILLNLDLDYNSNQTAFIEEDDITKDGNIFKCKYTFSPTDDFNCITVTGFATDNGLKYMGAKNKNSHFILYGIYINYKQ